MNKYDDIPYRGAPIPAAHPWRLLWTSTVFGGPRPDYSRARVLEIGCGDGATSLSIAAFEPTWTVLGIDASQHAIAAATSIANEAALGNATFVCGDLASVDIEPGAWDAVIAHGVYSWIDPQRRVALGRLVRRALAPDGLAYVSFNALPGWSVRGRVRDLIVRDPNPKADARAFFDHLSSHLGDDPWGLLLAKEMRRAQSASDFYFAHEYCGPHNDAFWVGDFIDDATRDGLRWVGDAQFDLREGRPYEQVRASLGATGVRGEELADLVGYRQFRCAVLARDDAAAHPPLDDEAAVRAAILSGIVESHDEAIDFQSGREQVFRGADGGDIHVDEPLCKAALYVLAKIHPDGLRFDDLIRAARRLLRESGGAETSSRAEAEVREGVARLWRVGALQLRLHRPQIRVDIPRRPNVPAFTRVEARAKRFVTNALGESMSLTPLDLMLVELLDGCRNEDELVRDFATAYRSSGRDETRASESAAGYVPLALQRFASWGLLAR